MSGKYSWRDRYEHAWRTFVSLWNSALNFIAETMGEEALDAYFWYGWKANSKVHAAYFPVTIQDIEREGVKALEKNYILHLKMLVHKIRVENANRNELVMHACEKTDENSCIKRVRKI